MWDSAGQEKYKSLIPSYVRGASIIFIIYDVSSTILLKKEKSTFANVKNWLDFIRNIKFDNSIIVLVGNKIDLDREVQYADGDKFATQENLLFFEISARTMNNLNTMFYSVVSELNFFEQYNVQKRKLVAELEEENKEGKNVDKNEAINELLNIKEGKKANNCKC